MSYPKLNFQITRFCIIALGLFTCFSCNADHFGGGFHGNFGNGNLNHIDNDTAVGNYRPGNGWVAPAYAAPTYIISNPDQIDYNSSYNCQTVQQCDSDGNCSYSQDCN